MLLRLVTLACACALAAPAAAGASSASSRAGWDLAQERQVVAAGVMSDLGDGRFHGEQPLTGGQLNDSLVQMGLTLGTPPVATAAAFLTVTGFDRLLVRQLGLADVAKAVEAEATRVGLDPPSYFGTEVVARLLGLRYNHPSPYDALELYPWDHITRAEAAWSEAVVLGFAGWEVGGVRLALASFTLPDYTPTQRAALRIPVSKIGMPYVWGGETDGRSFGQVHGGYDCSGLVYRTFSPLGLPRLTAAAYAGAIPKSRRLRFTELQPADVMFFGTARFWSRTTAANIDHTAIVLGNGWLINASGQGVAVGQMTGWREQSFAWGRRLV